MLTAISRVMTAVVVCPSSVGGSPIMPTRSTPPLRGVCACAGEAAEAGDEHGDDGHHPEHPAEASTRTMRSSPRSIERPQRYSGLPQGAGARGGC